MPLGKRHAGVIGWVQQGHIWSFLVMQHWQVHQMHGFFWDCHAYWAMQPRSLFWRKCWLLFLLPWIRSCKLEERMEILHAPVPLLMQSLARRVTVRSIWGNVLSIIRDVCVAFPCVSLSDPHDFLTTSDHSIRVLEQNNFVHSVHISRDPNIEFCWLTCVCNYALRY